ncbi:MAG: glycosyltransferase family 2 protein [Saccharofermentans sp.]|nr:glycosyltransferase family 2 protein [Saccharofermentans sp.]
MKISAVIPVYGCRAALPELHQRLKTTLSQISEDYEILFVNDNCPQNSWEVIEEICKEDHAVKGIELSRNFGQMKAILAGLDNAKGDWIVVMDCDLQDRPEEIINLYNKALEGYDVVFARRAVRKDNPLKVFLANAFYKVYNCATDGSYDGSVCNFSVISRKVAENYCKLRELHRGYVMYIKWLGFRQAAIDVQHDERFEGESSYSLRMRISMAIDLLTSQSDRIIRLFVTGGFVMSIISFLTIIGLIIFKFTANVAIGWTSIIATIMLVGSLIIMVTGIVGIYVGNIFMQTKGRPLYIVRQILNDED